MFWADGVAQELKKRNLTLEWVDDMKTPSGRIHVGALRGVVIHDLVYKALKDAGINTKYTYIFDNHDPMDALPIYLPKEKFEKYLGMPLYKIPSPVEGFKNYAEYYAKEFIQVFQTIGCYPEILWATDLYLSGKMNPVIKECLDKVEIIRNIYEELYKKEIPKDWYPFQVYCPNCGKVSTTKVTDWDGEKVTFTCNIEGLKWTKGCGYSGKVSPFSNEKGISGKLPWKVEWPSKWKVIGITVEGAGKDHMSKGGSHDLASKVCEKVLYYPVPYPIAYEWFLIGGKKMSTSKGVGSSASEILEILPPELLRFLMVKTRIQQSIDFDPSGDTIPKLFDDYQKAGDAYFTKSDPDLARIFELSQITEVKKPPAIRFSVLAQWVQMPNMKEAIEKEGLEEWAKYARIWVERYASEAEKFTVQKTLPEQVKDLSEKQKEFLKKLSDTTKKVHNAEELQTKMYELTKQINIVPKDAFSAIYIALLGKDHGPKAAWLIISLDRGFVRKRFEEIETDSLSLQGFKESAAISTGLLRYTRNDDQKRINPEIFSIDQKVKDKFPSISVGVAIIKEVVIEKLNKKLEQEKEEVLKSLQGLTTEQINQYPEVQSYRKLYKETGVDWHSRRPSPEALLRRVALNKGLHTVNTCVDAYNLVVMKHRVSIGAFDLDKIVFPTVLRFAKTGEETLLLGDSEQTKYKEGEIAYFDQKGGYNIDFNYRDAQRTAVQTTTKNLYINVDGVYDITPGKVQEVLKEACDVIIKYCGGKIELIGVETA